jgi:hypothetical protein
VQATEVVFLNLREFIMKLSLLLFVAGSASLIACAASSSDTATSGSAMVEPGCDVDAGPPPPAHEITVTANGTACAGRPFVGKLSADEKTLTITPVVPAARPDAGEPPRPAPLFDNGVDVGQSFSIKDCTFGIEISNTAGRSYAVRSYDSHGYAILDKEGMTAKQTAKYYFMGNPVPAREIQTVLTGPYDDSIAISEQVGESDLVWSPCGASRRLNAQMRSVVQNNSAKTGSALLELDAVFTIGLDWRSCEPTPTP